jgi:hypothetical protein
MANQKKYGLFVCDNNVVNYCNDKFHDDYKHHCIITIVNPHISCSALQLDCLSCIRIVSPNILYSYVLNNINYNLKETIDRLTTLFNDTKDCNVEWYNEWLQRDLDTIGYLFLILHRPNIDYITPTPIANALELATSRKEMVVSELLQHIRDINDKSIIIVDRCPEISYINCEHHIILKFLNDEEYVNKADVYIAQGVTADNAQCFFQSRNEYNHQKIGKWSVHNNVPRGIQKWDNDALAEVEGVNVDDNTYEGMPLSEKSCPHICDDPIISPLLRTIEYRQHMVAESLKKQSYSSIARIALNLGIQNEQNNKRLKKTQLLEYIKRIPMY